MSLAPTLPPLLSHDPTVWHLAPAPGVRQLEASHHSRLPPWMTMVYDGDLQSGHTIVPETPTSEQSTSITFTPHDLQNHLKKALDDIFEGDLEAGNTAMQALEKRIVPVQQKLFED